MINSVIYQLHISFEKHAKCRRRGQSAYLYPNDKTSTLEVRLVKEESLLEIFHKARTYLQKKIQIGHTVVEIDRQIVHLGYLIKHGEKLFSNYNHKHNTWRCKLLNLINAYAPQILRNYFPSVFKNSIPNTVLKTQQAYQEYSDYIEKLKIQLAEKLKVVRRQSFQHLLKQNSVVSKSIASPNKAAQPLFQRAARVV